MEASIKVGFVRGTSRFPQEARLRDAYEHGREYLRATKAGLEENVDRWSEVGGATVACSGELSAMSDAV